MNCTNCGSEIRIGGPRCCDGGASKRAAAANRWAELEKRVAELERAVAEMAKRELERGAYGK